MSEVKPALASKKMLVVIWGYIGIMENKMETTIQGLRVSFMNGVRLVGFPKSGVLFLAVPKTRILGFGV